MAGATLLHMCVDYDEMEIALWLLDRGMDVDAKAAIDPDGFGGHTSLFSTVVSQANFWPNHAGAPHDPAFTRLMLDRGADPTVRASLRKQLHPGYDEHAMHEYRDVTPLSWGEQFRFKKLVSVPAMRLIAERMGLPEPA
jgi:ankyrin repeat protein